MTDLRPNQRLALESLLAGSTFTQAAERAGVTDRTLRRWRKTPEFAEALSDGQHEAHTAARARLLALTTAALDALEIGLRDGTPWQRARVGLRLLEGLGHLTGHVQLAGRVAFEAHEIPADLDLGRMVRPEELPVILAAARRISRGLRGEEPEVVAAGEPEVVAVDEEEPDHDEEPKEDNLHRALRAFRRA